MTLPARLTAAAIVAVILALGYAGLQTLGVEGRALTFALVAGIAFGVVLQRSRFCFYCNLRDLVEKRQAMGVLAILVALAIGAMGYTSIFGAWLPTPAPDRLPPTAHIGPVSVVLAGASFVFGLGMAISGSCLSAHLYRLGEGSVVSPFAIIGALAGFGVGFATWNPLFDLATSSAVVVWLPHHLGYTGSLLLTLALLAGLAVVAIWYGRPGATATAPVVPAALTLEGVTRTIFVNRWSGVTGGILVGLIGTLYYFRVAPLGVTAELGSVARTAGVALDLIPDRLYGLDVLRGCATVVKEALLSNNGVFVMGLVGGSFVTSLIAGQFTPRLPTWTDVARGLGGGLLLGWGAMTALGCTVGVLLSGIHAGALSGWVFLVFCGAGAIAGMPLMRRVGQPQPVPA